MTTQLLFCSCRRLRSVRLMLPLKNSSHVGWLLRNERRNPTQNYLCHYPQLQPNPRTDTKSWWQVLFNSQNNHRTYITTMWKPLNWLSNVRSGFVESTKWLNLRACSDQRQGLYIGECQGQGKNAESLLTSEKGGTSTTAVTTHLTVCMLCCSWDGGIHLNCESCGLNPSGLRGKCQCAIQSSWMHGMALVMEERHPYQPGRDQKFRYPKTAMGMRAEKPYLVGILESVKGSVSSLQI